MNKSELIDYVASKAGLTKASATRAVNAMIDGVTSAEKRKKSTTIASQRSVAVRKPAVRAGAKPKVGAAPKRKSTTSAKRSRAAKVVKFRPGKGLKDTLK